MIEKNRLFSATIPPASDPKWEKLYAHKGRKIPSESYENWRREVVASTGTPLSATEIKGVAGIPDDAAKSLLGSLGATSGNALGTVLINGLAHGSWTSRFAGNTLKIRLDLFEKL